MAEAPSLPSRASGPTPACGRWARPGAGTFHAPAGPHSSSPRPLLPGAVALAFTGPSTKRGAWGRTSRGIIWNVCRVIGCGPHHKPAYSSSQPINTTCRPCASCRAYPHSPTQPYHGVITNLSPCRDPRSSGEPELPPKASPRHKKAHSSSSSSQAEPEPYRLRAVGHSLGGASLLIYAVMARRARRPHRLYRLILLTPAGFLQSAPKVRPCPAAWWPGTPTRSAYMHVLWQPGCARYERGEGACHAAPPDLAGPRPHAAAVL